MTETASPMRLLILDTAENAAEQFVTLLAKNRVASMSERIEDKSRLFEALLSNQWDILLLNEDAREVDASECVDFIRKNSIDTAPVVLLRQQFDVEQLSEANSKGIAGLASLQQPEHSVNVLGIVMKNITERRNLPKPASSAQAIAYIHDGMHVFANEEYIKLFQYSDLDEVLATPFMDMVSEECRKELKLSLRSRQKSGTTTDEQEETTRMELMALDANKSAFPVNLALTPTYYEGEHCLQVLIGNPQTSDADFVPLHAGVAELFLSNQDPGCELATPAATAPTSVQSLVPGPLAVKKRRRRKVADAAAADWLTPEFVGAALEQNSFVLMYQPVMSATSIKPEFYDIQLRMQGPHQETCTAEQIIKVVGDTTLVQQLDRCVCARVLRLFGDLYQQGVAPGFQLTITAQTISDPTFADWLAAQLAECAVAAHHLVLNMREADLLAHTAEATALIASLQAQGSRVCVTGYTNCQEIVAIITAYKVSLVRFDSDISAADSLYMLSLNDLKNLVDGLHENGVKVIAANVQDKATFDCAWLAEVDLVEGAWFQEELLELNAASFKPESSVLEAVV